MKGLFDLISIYLSVIEDKQDVEKFESIYYAHKDIMFNVAVAITKNHHFAEDALQNAFFTIAENIKKIKTDEPKMLKVLVYKIVRNSAIDVIRKEKKADKILDIDNLFDIISDDNITETVESNEAVEKIKKYICSFPEIYRDTLSLHYLFDFSIRDIAKIFNKPYDTIASRFKRGTRMLIEKIKEISIDE